MFGRLSVLCVVGLVLCVGLAEAHKSTADIEAAFKADGFTVTRMETVNGSRGFEATSNTVFNFVTKEAKKVYYVEGPPFAMGYLSGLLLERNASAMCTTYIDHFIVSLISISLDEKLSSGPFAGLYDKFVGLLGAFVISNANKYFALDLAKNIFPPTLVEEMHGVVAGAQAANASTSVTLERVITLNFGMDWLSATIFSGGFLPMFASYVAHERGLEGQLIADVVKSLRPGDITLPVFCDAFAAGGPATASGSGSFFARDFQLATALVFQDVQTTIIFAPSGGDHAQACALAPGMVGGMTCMNEKGVAMGVDTLRSAQGTPKSPGLNSLLLIRGALLKSNTSADVADYAAAAQRGCPFLYPVSDASGAGLVLEAGAYDPSPSPPDATQHVSNAKLRDTLPDNAFVQAHSKPDYRHGLYVRNMSSTVPSAFMDYNPALFKLAGVDYDPTSVTNTTGMVFPRWQDENTAWKTLHSSYFSPTRAPDHTIIVSNFAVTPQLRMTQMNFWSDLFPGEAMQYRFDTLNQLLRSHYGSIDLAVTKDIITFLSPKRTPGYWHNYANASDPMTAQVQGIICAADLQAKRLETKGGYWHDGFVGVTLPQYI